MQSIEYETGLGQLRNTPLDAVLGLAHALAGALRLARALATSGRPINLADLENPIGLLCAKALDLPPEQGRQMRVVLIALRQEVDIVAGTLRGFRDAAGTKS